ncbi:MAG TPA: protein kinase [Nitrospira sp.]|nr:protein kinase [Nitrospira sp.]
MQSGTKLGPYQIADRIGAGGMGEVYRATDTRLHRSVAIKVLPDHWATDSKRRERFQREAKAVSSLNHPHICTLHDVGEQDGVYFFVMELVEGETLESRLARDRLSLGKALEYAIQIADALDKAHRKGVVHRDLKPGNIMLTKSGVKLLDFGLAKLKRDNAPNSLSQGPTVDKPLTAEGTIVGTLQYMAPEQLEGKDADAHTDVFAFGSIVYEMVTGKKAFEGKSHASLIGAILKDDPAPMSELQTMTPPVLDHIVRTCLAKDPADRWQTAHDIVKQLEWIASSPPSSAGAPSTVPSSAAAAARRSTPWIAATVFFILTTVATVVYFVGTRSAPTAQPMRFTVSMPENVRLTSMLTVAGVSAAVRSVSPDGGSILFSGVDEMTGKMMLYMRPVDSIDARPLTGTEDAMFPFWSPRSDAVAFFTDGKLKRVAVNGGEPQIICDAVISAALSGGGTWNRDDVILAYMGLEGGLYKVSARGGTPSPVTTRAAGDVAHAWPQFLPDGNHFLYSVQTLNIGDIGIYVGSLDSPDRKLVFKGMPTMAVYAHPDHLLFERDGALMIQGFDTRSLELTGAAVRLVDNISTSSWTYHLGGFGAGAFSASENGVIVYRSATRGAPDRFLWIGRDGKEIGPVLPPGYYRDPALSPDGAMLAFARKESPTGDFDIYILELATGKETRFTLDPADDEGPSWSPGDGSAILYSSSRKNDAGLYRKNANGVGDEELIYPNQSAFVPYQWPTADTLIYFSPDLNPQTLSLSDRKSTPLGIIGADPAVSPDGKWLGYFAPAAGRLEVTTYPPSGTRFDVAPSGADMHWSLEGDAIFYLNIQTGELMSVDVTPGNPPRFGSPRRVYAGPLDFFTVHSFDLTPSEDRFIVHTPDPGGEITVLLNWPSLIENSQN